jgi:hypothetical protein
MILLLKVELKESETDQQSFGDCTLKLTVMFCVKWPSDAGNGKQSGMSRSGGLGETRLTPCGLGWELFQIVWTLRRSPLRTASDMVMAQP